MPRSKPPSYRDYSNLATLQSIRSGGRCCRLHPMITVIICTHLSYKSGQGAWVRCRSDRIVIIYRFFRPSPSHRHRIPINRAYICYSVRGNTYIGSSSSTPGYSTLPSHTTSSWIRNREKRNPRWNLAVENKNSRACMTAWVLPTSAVCPSTFRLLCADIRAASARASARSLSLTSQLPPSAPFQESPFT